MRRLALPVVLACLALQLILAVLLTPRQAKAGEFRLLGTITSAGTSVNNATTAVPFAIPPAAKLTLYCDASGRLLTDVTTVATSGATKGVPVAANTLFPTSVGSQGRVMVSATWSALVAWISTTGTANCDVWQRTGTE